MADDLRYPIGEFDRDFEISSGARSERMRTIAELPQELASAVAGLSEEQLDAEYRPGGWTIRQTVHHVADSHANSLIRFKLALTEDEPPTIRPYYEDRWAELDDSKLPVDISLNMLESIHGRWTALMDSMSEDDFKRCFIHPETGKWTLEGALALYAWHSRHHTAHITRLKDRKGW
jgi:uncharacterized damage-inducible protein DinB